jgi:hypothetical protein
VVLVPVAVPVPPVAGLVPVVDWLGLVPPVAAPVLGAAGVAAAPVPLPDDDEEEDELLGVVDDGALLEASSAVVEVVLSEAAAAPPIEVLAGATSACGFFGTTSWVALVPPQADRPTMARNIRATAVAGRRMGGS